MKKQLLLLLFSLLMIPFLFSCSRTENVLHIYSWGDYFSEDVLREFEKRYNCRVRVDVFDSNEAMYAKLKAGAEGYDIIVPSSYMAEMMHRQGMLLDLDKKQLPNVERYADRSYLKYTIDGEMRYTVPYFASFTGIGYLKSKVRDFHPTWHMFERTDLKQRISLLNDHREVLGTALVTLGYDVNTHVQKELDEAVRLVLQWKKQIAKFEVDDAKRALASGEFIMIQTYSGDMLQASAENPDIAFVIPEEGSTFTFDNFAILKTSSQQDLAHQFINFIYEPEICAANMNEIMYTTPHTEAVKMADPKLRSNPAFTIPEKVRATCRTLQDLGENNALYLKAWETIRQE